MPASTEGKKLEPKDVPSEEDCAQLRDSIKGILNPDGKNEKVDGYVNSTFDYIQNMLNKVANADDQDAASKEIADDLVLKFKGWAETQQQDRDQRRADRQSLGENEKAANEKAEEEKKA